MDEDAGVYLAKAIESLRTAESELEHGRYNSCANRCYYACFQAAIAAMLRDGITAKGNQWPHRFVRATFSGQLINRRRRYPAALRDTLTDLQLLRNRADYATDLITQIEAKRGVRRSNEFVAAVRQEVEGHR